MVPCKVCGKDTRSGGWVIGFPPAPDSQKMGLCKEHDTPEGRAELAGLWQQLMKDRIAGEISVETAVLPEQFVSISFTNGSTISYLCTDCGPTPHGTLRIMGKDGAETFIPMAQIRAYTVRPTPVTPSLR